jgi:hypothetical protein
LETLKKSYDSSVSSLQDLLRGENTVRRRQEDEHKVLLERLASMEQEVRNFFSSTSDLNGNSLLTAQLLAATRTTTVGCICGDHWPKRTRSVAA